MVERDLYPEIEHTVDAYGGYWKKTQDLRFEKSGTVVAATTDGANPVAPKRGDVDFVFCWPKTERFALVEVKYKRHNFAFAEINDDQRRCLDTFEHCAWLWLFMGERIGGKESPRQAWLVPWSHWKDIEDLFMLNGLKGMAHRQAHELKHRELHLNANDQLVEWEMQYHAGWGEHPATWSVSPLSAMNNLIFGHGR